MNQQMFIICVPNNGFKPSTPNNANIQVNQENDLFTPMQQHIMPIKNYISPNQPKQNDLHKLMKQQIPRVISNNQNQPTRDDMSQNSLYQFMKQQLQHDVSDQIMPPKNYISPNHSGQDDILENSLFQFIEQQLQHNKSGETILPISPIKMTKPDNTELFCPKLYRAPYEPLTDDDFINFFLEASQQSENPGQLLHNKTNNNSIPIEKIMKQSETVIKIHNNTSSSNIGYPCGYQFIKLIDEEIYVDIKLSSEHSWQKGYSVVTNNMSIEITDGMVMNIDEIVSHPSSYNKLQLDCKMGHNDGKMAMYHVLPIGTKIKSLFYGTEFILSTEIPVKIRSFRGEILEGTKIRIGCTFNVITDSTRTCSVNYEYIPY